MIKHKRTQKLKIIFILMLLIILVSCGKNTVTKKDAALFMDQYYSDSEEGDFNLLGFYYSDRIDRDELEDIYYQIQYVTGKIVSVKLKSSWARTYYRNRTQGKYFSLVYSNKYENGTVTETINLFAPKGSKELKITAHNYNLGDW